MSSVWSKQEVEATVLDYLDMLASELRGVPYIKAAHNENLRVLLDGRSRSAVERKHQNISAVLIELGFPYINGYKPLGNVQNLLRDVVRENLSSVEDLVAADVDARQKKLTVDDVLGIDVDPPVPASGSVGEAPIDYVVPGQRAPLTNYLQMEALNRSLGDAGEALVMEIERGRLLREGKDRLAGNVEQVSKTVGDHAGFDIRSYEVSGQDRFIEVKTTRYGKLTPFYISAGEVRFSEANADAYHLYRLFEFRQSPGLFQLHGDVGRHVHLQAINYRARF
ncbi:MAG: DUF3883 domain-containing protein [Gemmatimonadota bacterium]|nr:DUF3883 domain-containing protein [Gemmatimonadota bacterium]